MSVRIEDFGRFFEDVYGCKPFPWQERLLRVIVENAAWPDVLELPTGTGKTAAIDIALFHLAIESDRAGSRKAPVRIALVVDRRLVVDDAYQRARTLANALARPASPTVRSVAECLRRLAGDDSPPLIARRLRGGVPREDDWARTPSQPTILCSTVDQVGSRLLFRGYGVSDSMKPVHAGLLGSDCLILLDEAHLAEPFRQTLEWVQTYRGRRWREREESGPSSVVLLTATPGESKGHVFSLEDDDRRHPVLRRRLDARKPVRLRVAREQGPDAIDALYQEVKRALDHFSDSRSGAPAPALAVVVNRVARARAVFSRLSDAFKSDVESELMIGPARAAVRDSLAVRLEPIRTGRRTPLDRPFLLVATQCLEAGVDIDLDGLISEAAPIDSLRQRFGRLNRAGRDVTPYGALIVTKRELSPRFEDAVYGTAIREAWQRLEEAAIPVDDERVVDFGIEAFPVRVNRAALAPKDDAPILLPAHLDLLTHTSPIPAAGADVSLYLHGPKRQPDAVTVIWRADIDRHSDVRRLLTLVPPRAAEAIELPLWAVRRWLLRREESPEHLADVPTAPPDEDDRFTGDEPERWVFRWAGDHEKSEWIPSSKIRPGDMIVVPSGYGGCDAFGWNPESMEPVGDVARKAAQPFAGRRFAVRVAPGLVGPGVTGSALAEALTAAVSARWSDIRDVLLDLPLQHEVIEDLNLLDSARRPPLVELDVYGRDDDERPRGVIFVAPFGIRNAEESDGTGANSTEDDLLGSLAGFSLSLEQHSVDVEEKAAAFALAAGLSPERVRDLRIAGWFHDLGKKDVRFQRWLWFGDPLGGDGTVLAKSPRRLPIAARQASGLPDSWRHEALSVRLARSDDRLREAADPDLVLWLVGTHHGWGRPLFPHEDSTEQPPDVGPWSLWFDWSGTDWPALFVALKARYGVWELARMEAILRLADHRASEARAKERAG